MNEESLATLERSGHSAAELYDQKCQNIPTWTQRNLQKRPEKETL